MTYLRRTTALALSLALFACAGSENNPQEAQSHIERSIAYEDQGQYRAAMIEMRNAIQANPSDPSISLRYAELLMEISNVRQAIQLLENQPTDIASVLLAEAYLRLGKHLSAREALAKAKPESYKAENIPALLAQADFLSGQQEAGLNALRDLSANGDQTANKILIRFLLATNKNTEAADWLTQALGKSPQDPELLYLQASLDFSEKRFNDAETTLTEVLKILPDSDMLVSVRLQALSMMSEVLTNLGRSGEAFAYNKIIEDSNPEGVAAQQQYEDALKAANEGNLAAAEIAFEDILTQFPNNQQAALLLGMVNINKGNFEEGEALLTDNLDVEVAPVTLIQATALAQARLGKNTAAKNMIDRAILARPDDPTLLGLSGVIAINSGDGAKGVEVISKALQIDPTRTRLSLLLAQYYNQQEQPELALGHLRKAFSQAPDDWATTTYYLTNLSIQDEQTELSSVLDTLKANFPDSNNAQWLIAMADYRSNRIQEARSRLADLFNKSTDLNEINASYALVLEDMGDFDDAANVWLTSLNNEPSDRRYIERAINAKLRANERGQVIEWLNIQKTVFPEAVLPIDAGLVQLYVTEQDADNALAVSESYATNQQPMAINMRVAALQTSAITLATKLEFEQALLTIEQAIDLQPSNQQSTILAAQFESRANSNDQAMKRLDAFIESRTDRAAVVAAKANLMLTTYNEQEVYNFLQPIWTEGPSEEFAGLFLRLTRQLVSSRYTDAVDELLEALPNSAIGNVSKGDLYLANNNEEQAIVHYRAAIASNNNLVPALNNLAWILAKTNPEQALPFSARAAQLTPENSAVLDTHGWVLHLNGNKEAAVEVLERAVSLSPDDINIQQHLATAKR